MSNLSKIRRDKMIEFLETLKEQHSDDESLIAINQIEKELVSKRYGLVWEEHEEAVDVMMRENIPVFTEVKEYEISIAEGEGYNFLLEGDNLHSLHLLEKTHKGKVDVIYIDPPYNTGNKDFVYEDAYLDVNDGFRHSKWLSFMNERLIIAKNLLSKEGAIFISIDANEFAQLKLLCDSIFGESNFIGVFIWRKKSGGGQTDEYFVTEHEYIFGYRKSNAFSWYDFSEEAKIEEYRYQDDKGNFKITKLEKWGSAAHKEDRPTMYFSIKDPEGKEFYPVAPDGKAGRWRVGKERLSTLVETDRVFWQYDHKLFRWIPYEKTYFSEANGKLLKSRSILWDLAETGTATKLLTNIFGEKDVFQNPKPIELLKFLFKHTKSDLVLDFFAGSGSTAHAIMDLNKEEGVSRKFILCTNNENKICEEITYQRIETVIKGSRPDGSEYSEKIPANLKYYRTDFVAKDNEDLVDSLLEHVAEMIQLEHGIKLDNKSHIMIMNDEEADELEQNWCQYTDIKAIYVAQDVLLTASQEVLFGTADVHIIPDYYFNFELREAGELW